MNITENGRAITTVTVSRTHSLREPTRQLPRDEQSPIENQLIKNQRSFSNDKIATDCKTALFTPQRGSSLRHNGKTAFPISSPISNSHHSFQIIKPIDTSPRTSESIIDPEFGKTSQKFKFKPRSNNSSQGGPLIPDHNLKMDTQRDNKYTPRPPLAKRFSSDPDEANSDIDCTQSIKNPRSYSMQNQKLPVAKTLRSPTRAISHNIKSEDINCLTSLEVIEKIIDIPDELINGVDDHIQSDCEIHPLSLFTGSRSSLRKGSDSSNHSDIPARNSPSPTKTVKFNPNLSVKNIPPNTSKPNKSKTKPKPPPNNIKPAVSNKSSEIDTTCPIQPNTNLVECHEEFMSQCTNLIRSQMSLLETYRQNKISLNVYQKDLIEQIDNQRKLITSFQSVLTFSASGNCDKNLQNSEL